MKTIINENVIAFTRKAIVIDPSLTTNEDNTSIVMQAFSTLLSYGYVINLEDVNKLASLPKDVLINKFNEIFDYIKSFNPDIKYQTFWKNFPNDVMETDGFTKLYLQILHYMFPSVDLTPDEVVKNYDGIDIVSLTELKIVDKETFLGYFTDILSLPTSLTPQDQSFIEWFITNIPNLDKYIPTTIPFKETLCFFANVYKLPKDYKLTVTDVLRIAIAMSDGDITLTKKPVFKKFKRIERRYILELFENNTNCDVKELATKREYFLRLAERINPYDYYKRYYKTFKMFNTLRNEKVRTWNSDVMNSFGESLNKGLNKIAERPGYFIRSFDHILRTNSENKTIIFNKLQEVAVKGSTTILLSLLDYYKNRKNLEKMRSYLSKTSGRRKALKVLKPHTFDPAPFIEEILINAIKEKHKDKEAFGNVYIDEELKLIPIPKSMRTLQESINVKVRKQKTNINSDKNIIRFGVKWTDEHGRIDIDLSSLFVDEKFETSRVLDFRTFNLSIEDAAYHSGDVRHRIGNVGEYVDINIEKMLNLGYRYCMISARSFDNNPLKNLNSLFIIQELSTVKQPLDKTDSTVEAIKLTTPDISAIVAVIDLKERQYIYVDESTPNNVAIETAEYVESIINTNFISVYDILHMTIIENGRGTLVEDIQEADKSFTINDFTHYTQIANLIN